MNEVLVAKADINTLRDFAEKVASVWNGKEAGKDEEMAHIANEIVEKCDRLSLLLEMLEDYDY